MKPLKDIDLKILFEYVKHSRISDRDLAKKVGVSQPTITRKRTFFDKEHLLDYTAIPNFEKLGIEILAFTFATWSPETLKNYPEDARREKAKTFVSKHPNVIFCSSGRGLEMTRIVVTFHKDYSDYVEFMKQIENEWSEFLTKVESFTLSLKTDAVITPFSFKNLGEYMQKTE